MDMRMRISMIFERHEENLAEPHAALGPLVELVELVGEFVIEREGDAAHGVFPSVICGRGTVRGRAGRFRQPNSQGLS